ncbi:hypothetical protein SISNIDRAFT_490703 [Sistotremastrum niveocremeum HHB9708]|uniref:Nucleoplasmin-like domain-containing protein n=1 Tax=Sistotremastrum niveocremeum HHB9708 TaxID=1314777 RepID=A0A164NP47_9AGAM|nr:hypothetical protein SISNIDRAFT_490703 [Sistotremastrum niveocremeum HHB9708]
MFPSLSPWSLEIVVGEPILLIPDGDLCITNACIKDMVSESFTTLYIGIDTPEPLQTTHSAADATTQLVPLCWLRPGGQMSALLNIVLSQDDQVHFLVKTNSEEQLTNTISLFGYYFDTATNPAYPIALTPVPGQFSKKKQRSGSRGRRLSSPSSSRSPKRRNIDAQLPEGSKTAAITAASVVRGSSASTCSQQVLSHTKDVGITNSIRREIVDVESESTTDDTTDASESAYEVDERMLASGDD